VSFSDHKRKVNAIGSLLISLENAEENLADCSPLLRDYPNFCANLKNDVRRSLDRVRTWHRMFERQEKIFSKSSRQRTQDEDED
jgi:hypothetical protein